MLFMLAAVSIAAQQCIFLSFAVNHFLISRWGTSPLGLLCHYGCLCLSSWQVLHLGSSSWICPFFEFILVLLKLNFPICLACCDWDYSLWYLFMLSSCSNSYTFVLKVIWMIHCILAINRSQSFFILWQCNFSNVINCVLNAKKNVRKSPNVVLYNN